MKKYQCCPVCNGYGRQPGFYDPTYGFFNSVVTCAKCKGEMVIEAPEQEEQIPESAVIRFWKHLAIGFIVCFFGLAVALLVLDQLNLLCH